MKKPMGYVLNTILNGDLRQIKLETDPIAMKNYQLFVYVGQKCQTCSSLLKDLNDLATRRKKSLNVVLVYDFSTRPDANLMQLSSQTEAFEFFDGRGDMYYHLFDNPRYLSFVLTGPQHTILKQEILKSPQDLLQLESLITK